MSNLNIVVATHGKFGEELIRSAEMIAGAVENVYSLSLLPEKSFEDFLAEANELFASLEGPTIALVDLFGGTPSNVLTVLTKKYEHKVITGLNLPLFIDLYMKASAETIDVEELAAGCLATGKASFVLTNDELEK